jgi:uncharacterized protein
MINICLKTQAKQVTSQRVVVHIQERLPERMGSPCELTCDYQVSDCRDYYLLTWTVMGLLEITCQRCLTVFQENYSQKSQLAVCATDTMAETLMGREDCMVAPDHQVNFMDILTDDLHLFSPEKHRVLTDCDSKISTFIRG